MSVSQCFFLCHSFPALLSRCPHVSLTAMSFLYCRPNHESFPACLTLGSTTSTACPGFFRHPSHMSGKRSRMQDLIRADRHRFACMFAAGRTVLE